MTDRAIRQLQQDQSRRQPVVEEAAIAGATLFGASDTRSLVDPYPLYARLRAETPIHRTPLGPWVLTRYADVASILRDPRFGREGFERHFGLDHSAPSDAAGHRQSM